MSTVTEDESSDTHPAMKTYLDALKAQAARLRGESESGAASRAAQWAEHRERQRAERAKLRAETERVELTLDALVEAVNFLIGGWTPGSENDVAFATHLVQEYCGCEIGYDGFEPCEHWQDES